MTSPENLTLGQYPTKCQLCEVNVGIKWKCLDCRLSLCENCKHNIHPKFKNAGDHNVIDIKDVDQYAEAVASSADCEDHPGQTFCLFCKTCDRCVCPICVCGIHNGHDLVENTMID